MASSGTTMKKGPTLRRGPQIVALLLVVGLLGAMAIEPTRQLLEQRRRIDGMAGDLAEIRTTNEELRSKIERLQDPDFIEQQAREQAGLVKPGESSFRVLPPSKQQLEQRAEAKARRAEAPPPPEPGLLESFLRFVGFL
ncbi:MAG: FtsB family cell division protein [Actinomycetota bacterium]